PSSPENQFLLTHLYCHSFCAALKSVLHTPYSFLPERITGSLEIQFQRRLKIFLDLRLAADPFSLFLLGSIRRISGIISIRTALFTAVRGICDHTAKLHKLWQEAHIPAGKFHDQVPELFRSLLHTAVFRRDSLFFQPQDLLIQILKPLHECNPAFLVEPSSDMVQSIVVKMFDQPVI